MSREVASRSLGRMPAMYVIEGDVVVLGCWVESRRAFMGRFWVE